MYIALGKEKWISSEELIGIFDLDITSQSYLTRNYLRTAEKAGQVINTAEDLPKTFAVCEENGRNTVFLSQTSTATLAKRIK